MVKLHARHLQACAPCALEQREVVPAALGILKLELAAAAPASRAEQGGV